MKTLSTLSAFSAVLLILTACSTETTPESSLDVDTEDVEESEELNFIPDEGIRMMYASNAGAKLDKDGNMLLLYEANGSELHGQYVAVSEDGLTFEDEGEQVTYEEAGAFRSKQLPDGTWISYGFNTTKGLDGTCLTSQSSEDGKEFTADKGCRYELQEDDKGRMGVYEFFNDSKGNVVLLYLGDLMGMNNVRRAYSTDGGQSFEFTNDNVLGDEDDGGGARSFVDQKVVVMENGDVFLVAMKEGSIFGFISTDDGETFQPYGDEALLVPDDFNDEQLGTVRSLHDPQIVMLEDGRYRIYMTAIFGEGTPGVTEGGLSTLVSATSDSL